MTRFLPAQPASGREPSVQHRCNTPLSAAARIFRSAEARGRRRIGYTSSPRNEGSAEKTSCPQREIFCRSKAQGRKSTACTSSPKQRGSGRKDPLRLLEELIVN